MGRPKQEVHEALGRVFRLRFCIKGRPGYPSRQCVATIPTPIAEVMLQRSSYWRWGITDDGVLLSPADFEMPEWVQDRGSGE